MHKSPRFLRTVFTSGLAMFSMFFGSGNIVFPVLIGYATGDKVGYAVFGLILTAVVVPFVGLWAMMQWKGDYIAFFSRLSPKLGWCVAGAIFLLIGPLGAMPRCASISYTSFASYLPIHFQTFNILTTLLLFLLALKPGKLIDLLGTILSPLLVISLCFVFVTGLTSGVTAPSTISESSAFFSGLLEGYNTLDFFASFMFAGVIAQDLVAKGIPEDRVNGLPGSLAGLIGMGLLALVYTAIAFSASKHAPLGPVAADESVNVLAAAVLGSSGAMALSVVVALACLTTALALAVVFSNFVVRAFPKASYSVTLASTCVVHGLMTNLHFDGIQKILVPILTTTLPALVVLTGCNILYKTLGTRWLYTPVFVTLAVTIFVNYF